METATCERCGDETRAKNTLGDNGGPVCGWCYECGGEVDKALRWREEGPTSRLQGGATLTRLAGYVYEDYCHRCRLWNSAQ